MFLLYFSHHFDPDNPELVGIFETRESAHSAQSSLDFPTSWKGCVFVVDVPCGVFVHNNTFIHPAKHDKTQNMRII